MYICKSVEGSCKIQSCDFVEYVIPLTLVWHYISFCTDFVIQKQVTKLYGYFNQGNGQRYKETVILKIGWF